MVRDRKTPYVCVCGWSSRKRKTIQKHKLHCLPPKKNSYTYDKCVCHLRDDCPHHETHRGLIEFMSSHIVQPHCHICLDTTRNILRKVRRKRLTGIMCLECVEYQKMLFNNNIKIIGIC